MANKIQTTEQDLQKALELLGRKPRTPFSIKSRCPNGSPQVLLADPVFNENGIWKPFPTFLWLVCPELKLKAAHLEQNGLIRSFSARLDDNQSFRQEFIKGQREISQIRLKMARDILGDSIPEYILRILETTTIVGSIDITKVKCLHAHLAQELAFANNPIGKEILKLIGNCTGKHERNK